MVAQAPTGGNEATSARVDIAERLSYHCLSLGYGHDTTFVEV